MKAVLLVFIAVFVACQLSWSSTSAISLSHVNDQIQDTGAWVEPMYVEVESEADVVRLRHLAGRKAGGKKAGTSKGGNAKAGNAKGGNTKAADAKGGKKEKKKKEKDPVSCTSPIPADKHTKEIKIDPKLVEKAKKETHPKGKTPGKCDKGVALTESAVKEYLVAAWKAFGAVEDATKFADLNIKQVKKESTFCPNIMQGVKDVNTNKDPAGGLFQFTQQTFNTWAVKGFDKDRFNPLSNILAAVNAQVNAECIKPKSHKRVLNGSAGWTPSGGSNPFK